MKQKLPQFLLLLAAFHTAVPLLWLILPMGTLTRPEGFWWLTSAASGLGLLLTVLAPYRYWPVWLLLLTQKLTWLAWVIVTKTAMPWPFWLWEAGWLCILIALLRHKYQQFLAFPRVLPDWRAVLDTLQPEGKAYTLGEKQQHQPVLLFFMRHSGCTFCREMLDELNITLEKRFLPPTLITVVTQSDVAGIEQLQLEYPYLAQVDWVSDPERTLYQAFGIRRARLGQVFGLKVLWRGLQANRHGIGMLDGDGFQMPGVVLVRQHEILAQQVFTSAADKVDWHGWRERCKALYE